MYRNLSSQFPFDGHLSHFPSFVIPNTAGKSKAVIIHFALSCLFTVLWTSTVPATSTLLLMYQPTLRSPSKSLQGLPVGSQSVSACQWQGEADSSIPIANSGGTWHFSVGLDLAKWIYLPFMFLCAFVSLPLYRVPCLHSLWACPNPLPPWRPNSHTSASTFMELPRFLLPSAKKNLVF